MRCADRCCLRCHSPSKIIPPRHFREVSPLMIKSTDTHANTSLWSLILKSDVGEESDGKREEGKQRKKRNGGHWDQAHQFEVCLTGRKLIGLKHKETPRDKIHPYIDMGKTLQHVQQSALKEAESIRRQTNYLSGDKVYLEMYGLCVCVYRVFVCVRAWKVD